MRNIFFLLFSLIAFVVLACSDDDSSYDYPFDREVMNIDVIRTCGSGEDSSTDCYKLRFHYPYDTEDLEAIYLWIGEDVVDDTSKEISSSQMKKADSVIEFREGETREFDTIDLTPLVKDYLNTRQKVQVVLYCDYSEGDNGIAQRYFLHFGDDQPPSLITAEVDSVWTTGAVVKWVRPTDQTDFNFPTRLSGTIVGYNIVISSDDTGEDLRKLEYTLSSAFGEVVPNARLRSSASDSVYVDSVPLSSKEKDKVRFVVLDGYGFDMENDSMNRFSLVLEGLKSKSKYYISISSYDSVGNTPAEDPKVDFETTDSIAPLMPTKLFSIEDTLYPGEGFAALDSNNRLRIFWSRAADPLFKDRYIEVDTLLTISASCHESDCYENVAYYEVMRYNSLSGMWDSVPHAGGFADRYEKSYDWEDGQIEVVSTGRLVVDTIFFVPPGDTVILKIRARDASGFYSAPLIDTVYVSPGALAKEMECPEGFVPVAVSDSNKFCMERFEHMDESGEFMTNVLHSEAQAACSAVSASGFNVSLCNERDWELVCLSGGSLSYGVIEEDFSSPSDYLKGDCNVGNSDSKMAQNAELRSSRCVNPMGVHDMPGQFQEWVMGRSADTLAVLKGSSYKRYTGLESEDIALCTNRSFPVFTRLDYTEDTVYLYREGTKIDTVYEADTSRTLYKIVTKDDFKDSLQFFDVQDSSGNSIGVDYAPYSEYKAGGDEWLKKLANGLVYKPSEIKVVFFTGETIQYRKVSEFYKSPTIGFRCCAYPE